MVFYADFNGRISVISRRQLILFMPFPGFTSTKLRLCSVLPKDNLTKTQSIQCGSNPGHLDYKLNTLPLGHTEPFNNINSQ